MSDSIDEKEALALARAYFLMNFGGCGGVQSPKDHGKYWQAEIGVGYWSQPGPPIFIDKKTGATKADGKAEVADPKVYIKSMPSPG